MIKVYENFYCSDDENISLVRVDVGGWVTITSKDYRTLVVYYKTFKEAKAYIKQYDEFNEIFKNQTN